VSLNRDQVCTPPAAERLRARPATSIPDPLVIRLTWRLEGDDLRFAGDSPLHTLPIEFAFRELLDLRLDDRALLVEFTNAYGLIEPPERWPVWPGNPDRRHHADAWDFSVPVGQVAHHLGIAQLLAQHCLAHLQGEDVTTPWRRALGHLRPRPAVRFDSAERPGFRCAFDTLVELWATEEMPRSADPPGWDADDDAWLTFVGLLREGLEDVGPGLEYLPRRDWIAGDRDRFLGAKAVGLCTAVCVQIYNAIVLDLPVLTCANETCRRSFFRQRSDRSQHWTKSVMYCSRSCARAQQKRAARRTARQRKGSQ
jgi:hypothetical protein